MDLKALAKQAERFLRSNSPAILTALGVSGTITTAYLASKASFKAARMIEYDQRVTQGKLVKEPVEFRAAARLVWKCYIPTVITGLGTLGCIIFATKIGNRRTAAITAAYSLSERAFIEYKDKVVENLGKSKEQKVRDDIVQDQIRSTAPTREIVLYGAGPVMCCELHTGRYFLGDMELLKKAQNEINDRVLKCDYATLTEFHSLIKVSPIQSGSDFGWTADRLLELEFTTVLADETRPCLAFGYNYLKPL